MAYLCMHLKLRFIFEVLTLRKAISNQNQSK